MTRLIAGVVVTALMLLGTTSAHAQNAPTFSKNYFLTGDYVVAGVPVKGTGVNGFANKQIEVPAGAVPPGAEPVAAFLYWASVVPGSSKASALVGARFKGHDIASVSKLLNPQGTSPCWSSGGATGSSNGSKTMMLIRADVFRFLERGTDGQLIVTGPHSIRLPDAGSNGNGTPFTLGASLLVIYRVAGVPLRSIVVYEGGFVVDQAHETINQTLKGFYQASSTTPAARLTTSVG